MKKNSDLFFWRRPEYSRRELFSILAKAHRTGYLDDETRKMIENILNFKATLVREIMIPRTDIVSINAEDAPQDIVRELAESRYTRVPVHRGSVDNIVGILNVKDLLKTWSDRMTRSDIFSHLTKPYYIPETKNAHLLFREFQSNKKHIAIVIDEYGGTSGLVTLEDLLEEIVGDIRDEHEEGAGSDEMVETAEGAVIFDGRTEIEKVEERLCVTLERGRYETISGLVLDTLRRIPHRGERLRIGGMDITVESADERSIKKVKIKKMEDEEETNVRR
ncbi:MAG: hemolysin family protein [Smithellaceae bacterium]|nr:HlyC/CorC family transporter [Syntrophaceae bacterium]MDD4240066.1 hemolysin family protein [Smithellaceae bacterium]NLX51430.1 HlyC/CorC family transporter [Deltaproteobacteria bacterium]